jgi:hypothetical protein
MEGAKILSEEEEKNVLVSEREEKRYPRRKYSSYYVVSHSIPSLSALC